MGPSDGQLRRLDFDPEVWAQGRAFRNKPLSATAEQGLARKASERGTGQLGGGHPAPGAIMKGHPDNLRHTTRGAQEVRLGCAHCSYFTPRRPWARPVSPSSRVSNQSAAW